VAVLCWGSDFRLRQTIAERTRFLARCHSGPTTMALPSGITWELVYAPALGPAVSGGNRKKTVASRCVSIDEARSAIGAGTGRGVLPC
jgi:hypothetical protein